MILKGTYLWSEVYSVVFSWLHAHAILSFPDPHVRYPQNYTYRCTYALFTCTYTHTHTSLMAAVHAPTHDAQYIPI